MSNSDKRLCESNEKLEKAVNYIIGEGKKQDIKKFLKLCEEAAEAGNIEAQFILGKAYLDGCYWLSQFFRTPIKDEAWIEINEPEKGVKWLEKAGENGDERAIYALGLVYYWRKLGEPNYKKALEYFYKIADKDKLAQFNIGLMHEDGNGVELSIEEAKMWYEKSANKGCKEALFNLASIYYFGKDTGKVNIEESINWYKKAIECGYGEGASAIGIIYEEGYHVEKNLAKAMEYYRLADELGDSNGALRLGDLYFNGGYVKKNYSEAMKLYEKSARLGNPLAFYNIGNMFKEGLGVEVDYATAVEFFRKAGKLGYIKALVSIGSMYEEGIGFEQDYEKARMFYERAGEFNCGEGFKKLGNLYEKGLGVERNHLKAFECYKKANELGVDMTGSLVYELYNK